MVLRGEVPKLILMVEVTGSRRESILPKLKIMQEAIRSFGYRSRITTSRAESEKYWRIRHESFNLLRKHVQGMHTAPFIDDVVVPVETLPEFLPKLITILDREKCIYTIAGHPGDGNFHIIPLMNFRDPKTREIIPRVSHEVYELVLSYGGSITAEHNDGLIRTPFLERMFGPFMTTLFKQVKTLFDDQVILNPRKKVGATEAYMIDHLKKD